MASALLSLAPLAAQDNMMPFMTELPQSRQFNPANMPSRGGYMLLPVMSGVSVGFESTGFRWNDAFTRTRTDSLKFDADKLAAQMDKNSLLRANADISLLGFGFTAGSNYITFGVNSRTQANATLPVSLLDVRYGNWDYHNNCPIKQSVSDLSLNAYTYLEYALGYTRKVNDKLRVGATVKILNGIMAASADNLNITVDTKETNDGYAVGITTQGEIMIAAPLLITNDEEGYIDKLEYDSDGSLGIGKNNGFAIDLGASYDINDKWTVGLSLLDLGSINWKNNITTLSADNSFEFSGVNVNDAIKDKNTESDSYWTQLEDSLTNIKNITAEVKGSFKTKLNSRIIATGEYKPFGWLTAGGVLTGTFIDGKLYSRLSVNGALRAGKVFTFMLNGTVNHGGRMALGTGMQLKLGGFQLFAMADRMPMKVAKSYGANVRFGINFLMGWNKADKTIVEEE